MLGRMVSHCGRCTLKVSAVSYTLKLWYKSRRYLMALLTFERVCLRNLRCWLWLHIMYRLLSVLCCRFISYSAAELHIMDQGRRRQRTYFFSHDAHCPSDFNNLFYEYLYFSTKHQTEENILCVQQIASLLRKSSLFIGLSTCNYFFLLQCRCTLDCLDKINGNNLVVNYISG